MKTFFLSISLLLCVQTAFSAPQQHFPSGFRSCDSPPLSLTNTSTQMDTSEVVPYQALSYATDQLFIISERPIGRFKGLQISLVNAKNIDATMTSSAIVFKRFIDYGYTRNEQTSSIDGQELGRFTTMLQLAYDQVLNTEPEIDTKFSIRTDNYLEMRGAYANGIWTVYLIPNNSDSSAQIELTMQELQEFLGMLDLARGKL